MNTFRLVVMVLVTYALGLGTGMVGGVVLSYNELSRPVAAASPSSPAPTVTVTATVAVTPAPTSTSVSVSNSPVAMATPAETPSGVEPPPIETPSKTPSAQDDLGTLSLSANKGDGYVTFVDGHNAGETPVEIQLSPGKKHKIKVEGGDKYGTWQGTVTLAAGEKKTIKVALHSKASATPTPAAASGNNGGGYSTYHPTYHGGGSGNSGPSVTGSRRF